VQAGLQGEWGLGADASVIGETVRYVDFGFTSAREYWTEVAQPAYEGFVNDQTRGNAIVACLALWPLHDWLWHEQHPGEDPRKSKKDYDQFRQQLFGNCPELEWLRNAADGGKHRYLGRSNVQVREVAKTWPSNSLPLTFVLDNGSEHNLADVLHRIAELRITTASPHYTRPLALSQNSRLSAVPAGR
jgi:hypothetical protein